MENEKKLYTLIVHSENIAGILNQVTAVFTRSQVNIESLNVSASSIPGVHRYTITAIADNETIVKIAGQIEKKVDVLVIVCIDSDSLSEVVREAKSAGIPVISYDRLIKNADVDLYISFDNEQVGTLMGEALVKAGLPNKKVMMLSGPNEDNNVSLVERGFKDVISSSTTKTGNPKRSGWFRRCSMVFTCCAFSTSS